jgi:hypothetical protein
MGRSNQSYLHLPGNHRLRRAGGDDENRLDLDVMLAKKTLFPRTQVEVMYALMAP